MSIEGMRFVITGSAAGIGAATARVAASKGAAVMVSDLASSAEAGEQLAAGIRAAGGTAAFHVCDVTDAGQVEGLMAASAEAFGGIDVLHNNAGVHETARAGEETSVETMPVDVFRWVVEVNAIAPWICAKAAVPYLKQSDYASIINAASTGSQSAYPRNSAYGTSKGGIRLQTQNLAVDLGPAPQVLPVPLGGDAEEMTARLNEAWQADHAAELALFAAAAAELEAAAVEPAPRPGELEVLLELDLSLSPTPPAEGDLVLIVDPGVPPAVGDAGRPRRVVQPLELTDFDGATARLFAPPEEWRRWSALPFDLGASPLALPVEPGTDAGATADSLNALWQEEYDRALARAEAEALEISAELARARPGPGQLAVTVLLDGTLSSTPLQQGDLVLLIDPGSAPVPGDAGRPRRVIGPLELGDFDGISVRMFVPPDEWLRWRSLPGELGGAPMAIPVPPGSDVEEMTAALDAAWRAEHESATADLDAPADGQFWVSLPVVLANPGVAPREGDIVFLVDPGSPAEVDDEGNVPSPRIPPNVLAWRPLAGWDAPALHFWPDADLYAYYPYPRHPLGGRALLSRGRTPRGHADQYQGPGQQGHPSVLHRSLLLFGSVALCTRDCH